MNDNININKQCMEEILCHLTKLICLLEFGESKEMARYVDMVTSVSAQLLAIEEIKGDKNLNI